jgi:hypothetical protein
MLQTKYIPDKYFGDARLSLKRRTVCYTVSHSQHELLITRTTSVNVPTITRTYTTTTIRDSSVGIMTSLWPEPPRIAVRFRTGATDFPLLQDVQTD